MATNDPTKVVPEDGRNPDDIDVALTEEDLSAIRAVQGAAAVGARAVEEAKAGKIGDTDAIPVWNDELDRAPENAATAKRRLCEHVGRIIGLPETLKTGEAQRGNQFEPYWIKKMAVTQFITEQTAERIYAYLEEKHGQEKARSVCDATWNNPRQLVEVSNETMKIQRRFIPGLDDEDTYFIVRELGKASFIYSLDSRENGKQSLFSATKILKALKKDFSEVQRDEDDDWLEIPCKELYPFGRRGDVDTVIEEHLQGIIADDPEMAAEIYLVMQTMKRECFSDGVLNRVRSGLHVSVRATGEVTKINGTDMQQNYAIWKKRVDELREQFGTPGFKTVPEDVATLEDARTIVGHIQKTAAATKKALEDQVQGLAGQVRDATGRADTLNRTMTTLQGKLEEAERKIAETEARNTTLTSQLEEEGKKRQAAELKTASLRGILERLKQRLDDFFTFYKNAGVGRKGGTVDALKQEIKSRSFDEKG